jgi:hypothetical protein
MTYVFIIGIARTGSKIYMSALNQFSDIDIVNEMHYLAPWYVRKDATRSLRLRSEPLTSPARVERAVELMFSGKLQGTFWNKREQTSAFQQRLIDIPRDYIVDRLNECPGTADSVFRVLLQAHARVAGKSRAGAKFPVDISCVHRLVEWFPNEKYVHLIRDPRAIYGSMVVREANSSANQTSRRIRAAFRRLPYLILQYRRAARVHAALARSSNYYLSRFEDVATNPVASLRRLCEFLSVEYDCDMPNVRKVDSSYGIDGRIGIDGEAANRWQQHLNFIEKYIITKALRHEMATFGYSAHFEN